MLEELSRTLSFVSDDAYRFSFERHPHPEPIGRYFDLVTEARGNAEAVVLFSGGLDSFAGALEELLDRRHRVALVSHWSSTKLRRVQSDLVRELAKKIGRPSLFHVPVTAQLAAGTNCEGSHRTRSFLFAALAAVVARAFGRDTITFYENGIVSLNLPPAAQVVGARATRSTHPQSLEGFSRLFSLVFQERMRVDNPSFWRTKKEVVEQIARLGFADLIRHTRSCADVHNLTRMHPALRTVFAMYRSIHRPAGGGAGGLRSGGGLCGPPSAWTPPRCPRSGDSPGVRPERRVVSRGARGTIPPAVRRDKPRDPASRRAAGTGDAANSRVAPTAWPGRRPGDGRG